AEDGIRDRNVTGVQTCALPISSSKFSYTSFKLPAILEAETESPGGLKTQLACILYPGQAPVAQKIGANFKLLLLAYNFYQIKIRSEERRVGKEYRIRYTRW